MLCGSLWLLKVVTRRRWLAFSSNIRYSDIPSSGGHPIRRWNGATTTCNTTMMKFWLENSWFTVFPIAVPALFRTLPKLWGPLRNIFAARWRAPSALSSFSSFLTVSYPFTISLSCPFAPNGYYSSRLGLPHHEKERATLCFFHGDAGAFLSFYTQRDCKNQQKWRIA